MNTRPSATVVHRMCSWCGREFAQESWRRASVPEITTWGICPSCLELFDREGAKGSAAKRTGRRPLSAPRR